jgi:phosphate acetyltransferase
MDLIARFKAQAKDAKITVVLPESEDERILAAAKKIAEEGWAKPIIVGAASPAPGVGCLNPDDPALLARYAAAYRQTRPDVSEKVAMRLVKKPLLLGGMAVSTGDADCMVAGAANTTANVISAAGLTVGLGEGMSVPSSFFVMHFPSYMGGGEKVLVYADCGVNIQPTTEQLADIAIASADSAIALLGIEPKIAMLSFSTKGSGQHADSYKVMAATEQVQLRRPDLMVDGELQADSALVARVAAKKCPQSAVAGKADVLVFPDLDAGNIGYKLSQYLGGARAYGPILQGFRKPCSDLSRGATADDVVGTAAIVAAIAAGKKR